METTRLDNASPQSRPTDAGADRAAALAEARQRAQAAQAQAAQEARANQAEQLAQSRDAIARALGANTRLSIERSNASDIFVYRAIDNATGEIVREWPPQQFAEFIRELQPRGEGDTSAEPRGVVVDEEI